MLTWKLVLGFCNGALSIANAEDWQFLKRTQLRQLSHVVQLMRGLPVIDFNFVFYSLVFYYSCLIIVAHRRYSLTVSSTPENWIVVTCQFVAKKRKKK